MKHYAGLNIAQKETAICVVNSSGEFVKEGFVATTPADIDRYLKSLHVKYENIDMEASNSYSDTKRHLPRNKIKRKGIIFLYKRG